jgi:hypothetical protein
MKPQTITKKLQTKPVALKHQKKELSQVEVVKGKTIAI